MSLDPLLLSDLDTLVCEMSGCALMAQRFLRSIALLVMLAGCQSTSVQELRLDAAAGGLQNADFPAPAHLLRGFDEREPGGTWRVGDEVLFGMRLRRDGRVRHWLLQLRVLEVVALGTDGKPLDPFHWSLRINGEVDQFTSGVCAAEVVVMDRYGQELGRSQPYLPRDFLDRGIADACRLVRTGGFRALRRKSVDGKDARGPLDIRPLAEATVSALALLQVVQEDSLLAPILWQVIEKPSVWSMVSNMGVDVMLRPKFHRVSSAASPIAGVTASTWRLPLSLEVNQRPALDLDLLVADSAPPFSLACGLLGTTARHPSEPNLDFSLLLLSARRGPPAVR